MTAPGYTIITAVLMLALGFAWHSSRWLRGKSDAVNLLRDLSAIPRRYLVNVHDIVARDRRSTNMHMVAAGSFVVTEILVFLVHVFGIYSGPLVVALVISSSGLIAGALMTAARRLVHRPSRLSGGIYNIIPIALMGVGIFNLTATLPLLGLTEMIDWQSPGYLAVLAFGFLGTLFMIPGMVLGPMRHALSGALNLGFHTRPERFSEDVISSDLRPIEMEAKKLGVENAEDFNWKQLLSFDACVQCGRCEEVCPAYAAGAQLNPKKFIYDLWASSTGPGHDKNYAGSPHPGRATSVPQPFDHPIIGGLIDGDTLWACTTCRACVYECPMMIEHVDAVIDLRRFETLEQGATPGKGAEILETLALTDTQQGKSLSTRLDWGADLDLPLAHEQKKIDLLLWLGEGAFEPRNQRTLRALVKILIAGDVDFAVLGKDELDCGDVARRLGDEATFQSLAKRNIATLAKIDFSRIITTDPHVLHCLAKEYPAFGGHYEVTHHTTYVADLIDSGAIALRRTDNERITFHDPCYLGRYSGETTAPRKILQSLGFDLHEMERHGMNSFCCGGGGGAALTDVPAKKRIPDIRMAQARETGTGVVAVACPNCALMLEGVSGNRLDVVDIAELVVESLDLAQIHGQTG